MIETITLIRVDDDIWVTSNDDALGVTYSTLPGTAESHQFMTALTNFFIKRDLREGVE